MGKPLFFQPMADLPKQVRYNAERLCGEASMPIDFRNLNTLWASILVETLARLGLKVAVVCPGSRSAPLAIAFAQHPDIEAIPVLDERSASFFALGLARRSHTPVALVCSSGTAGANFYSAVIEAHESQVPLLVLTADRPPELRDCNAGQTIDQQKLFGDYVRWYHELAVPMADQTMLAYVRQMAVHAWARSHSPNAGAVHLNCPFRDPLAPVPQPEVTQLRQGFSEAHFFAGLAPSQAFEVGMGSRPISCSTLPWVERGIIIAGPAQPEDAEAYCKAIAHLSKTLGYPVLAEGLSPLRNYAALNPYLIAAYDWILRDSVQREMLVPEVVIRIGETPTSKELRSWLQQTQPLQWVIDAGDRNLDPLHLRTTHLDHSVEEVAQAIAPSATPAPGNYLSNWLSAEVHAQASINHIFSPMQEWIEGKVAWMLSRSLPFKTPLFIANSMPIRDVEWFWQPNQLQVQPYFNRGANGIDGTLSTALGVVHGDRSGVLLTGDLALLHDTNGLLIGSKLRGHLTIVLINNNGGGIFETLAIAQFEPPFEDFFATPQRIEFAKLCAVYGVEYIPIQSWKQLEQCVSHLPTSGIRLLEVRCDRKANAQWLRQTLGQKAPEGQAKG
ncbi:2-succinyl-5-enolpyruvyl-6-hydroxy-3-cyclohexene-1-carboxylic-acid synthase [Leptolyngbya sp. AN02str]|uniref:2-succinyl-5-enolpyruvyl-6-hydroxy-3- cyclohexene-1-carboxylic-acid synthase n=1 Tax=Leptolyngbya sp. AN02str TaxID=3423363 RepID=UPI003D30F97A